MYIQHSYTHHITNENIAMKYVTLIKRFCRWPNIINIKKSRDFSEKSFQKMICFFCDELEIASFTTWYIFIYVSGF